MLLPSAFSCDGRGPQPQKTTQRPKLPSFSAYRPQFSTNARPGPLSSSCRALQAILGASAIAHRTALEPPRELGNPFSLPEETKVRKETPQQPPHRSANKRRRSEFEEDMGSDVLMEDCERIPESIRTPKRRRRVPLAMPLGLSAADFRALEAPVEEVELDMPSASPQALDYDSAYGSSPSPDEVEWTEMDDRMLVETVLEKLKLSRRDWNDCARLLDKDRDTLERRWSLLVGQGDVGLRRGGKIARTNLDISSW